MDNISHMLIKPLGDHTCSVDGLPDNTTRVPIRPRTRGDKLEGAGWPQPTTCGTVTLPIFIPLSLSATFWNGPDTALHKQESTSSIGTTNQSVRDQGRIERAMTRAERVRVTTRAERESNAEHPGPWQKLRVR